MSRLLDRLDRELASRCDLRRWVEIHAERACYFARVGRFAEAKTIVEQLRRDHSDALVGRGIVRVMLAEGLIHYFKNVSVSARDRFFRAYLVSTLTGDVDLGRLAAAWVAHVDFDQGNYDGAFEYLAKSFADLSSSDYSAVSRVGLVLGDAYLYIGQRGSAQFWYECARQAAVSEGDQAALGAVMYNRSAFGLSRLTLDWFVFGAAPDDSTLQFCEMELDSAWEFQKGTNVSTLVHLINICRARALTLRRRFVDARRLFAHHHAEMHALEDRPNRNDMSIELAYCCFMGGDESSAEGILQGWSVSQLSSLDSDDALVNIGMLQGDLGDIASRCAWFAELPAIRARLLEQYGQDCEKLISGLRVLDNMHRARLDIRNRIHE